VALELQKNSLSRVVGVATDGILVDLRDDLINIGNSLQRRPEIREALQSLNTTSDPAPLIEQLDDLLVNGFVGAADIDLIKLRVYNNEYQFITESSRGMSGLQQTLPDFIAVKAKVRTGANSLKALVGLWTDSGSETPLYSLLLPIGGLRTKGIYRGWRKPSRQRDDSGESQRAGAECQHPGALLLQWRPLYAQPQCRNHGYQLGL
jgi:hypothetical protein